MKAKIFGVILGLLLFPACSEESQIPEDTAIQGIQREAACSNDDTFIAWCGYKNPEDLASTPDNKYLLATGFGGLPVPILNEMTLTELSTMQKEPVDILLAENLWGDPTCIRSNTDFSTHGLDIVKRLDGKHMVAVTNHLPKETVEMFELIPMDEGWQLVWRGCVESPIVDSGARHPMFNDVALTNTGSFYVTEMYNGKMPFDDLIAIGTAGNGPGWGFTELKDTGLVWVWSADAGFRPVIGTEGSFPNGIAFNQDGNTLFVNYWFSGKTIKFDIASRTIQASHYGGRADNLTLSHGSIWTAKHDMTVTEYLEGCPADAVNCFLPFSVYELDLEDLSETNAWNFHSDTFGFGTVAVPIAEQVWLGSAHGDRIASFDR